MGVTLGCQMEYYHSKQKSFSAHIRYSLPPFYWHASSPVQPMTPFLHFYYLSTVDKSGYRLCNSPSLRGRYPLPACGCCTPSHHQPFGRQKTMSSTWRVRQGSRRRKPCRIAERPSTDTANQQRPYSSATPPSYRTTGLSTMKGMSE